MPSESTMLLTGATGLLGRCLLNSFSKTTEVIGIARTKCDKVIRADLTDVNAIRHIIKRYRPSVIVHAAAMTDVDGCENNRSLAWKINVEGTRNLVDAVNAEMPQAKIVYISSDQVYAGPGPSRECQACPRTIYALTKKWAEDIVLTRGDSLVLRINFLAPGLPNRPGLTDWLLHSLDERKAITVFEDALFNPLYAEDIDPIISALIQRDARGIFNVGAHGEGMSKADFALILAQRLNLPTTSVRIGCRADLNDLTQRPLDTRMDVSCVENILGFELPTFDHVIECIVRSWRMREVKRI